MLKKIEFFSNFNQITAAPQLSMESVSIRPGEKAVMSCEIFGYPSSTVSWSFIPCPKADFDPTSCDESKKISFTVSAN